MPIRENTILSSDTVRALDREFIKNFSGELDRLVEMLGLFQFDTVAAGTALYQYKVVGQLENSAVDPGSTLYQKTTDTDVVAGKTYYTKGSDGTYTAVESPAKANLKDYYVAYVAQGSSSGDAYVEGDFVRRSHYKVTAEHLGKVTFAPYVKQTTAQAILEGGLENSVYKTDRKAVREMRSAILNKFFGLLAKGTTITSPASGSTYNLQQLLAFMTADMGDVLETSGDEGDIIYFVNRQDAYGYLAEQNVTTQTTFGLEYLESFLGVKNVLLTNKVASGSAYATPVENIHIIGMDYGTLGNAGLSYSTDSMGLIGVNHREDRDHVSVVTDLVRSANFIPEVLDFIVKGSMAHVG